MVLVLHRRAGKTTATLNHHLRAATDDDWTRRYLLHQKPDLSEAHLREILRVRHYGHVLPQLKQAKLTSWEMLKYYASFIPGHETNESELRIDIPVVDQDTGKVRKGHIRRVQLFGADNIDKLRGGAFSGISLDEYGDHPPTGFGDVISKALADHLGYCIWEGTIRGKNQLYRIFEAAKGDAEWFTLWQDVDASLAQEDDAAIVMIRQAIADDVKLVGKGIMTQEEFDQEWHLSTEAAIKGSYWGKLIAQARKDGRITRVPFDPAIPVDTDWDIGVDDATAIWFTQSLAKSREVRVIDYLTGSEQGLEYYIRQLKERADERGYTYGEHWGPHDIEVTEFGTGKTRLETARRLGLRFKVTKKLSLADGIAAVRQLLPRCYFDEDRCRDGIDALTHYRKTWSDKYQQFTDEPVHDWSSHPADAFRGLAVRHKTPEDKPKPPPVRPAFRGGPSGHSWMGG